MSLVVAGAGGDSGKTLVSLGLASAWRQAGVDVRAFKKGPDYIDAAWLTRAAGSPARNLDTWMMGDEAVRRSFAQHTSSSAVALVEGNRGLFDGLEGTSTAALAKTLDASVVLVVDVTKTTRTAAAFVAGCRALDPALDIAGVVLNRVGGERHLQEARSAIQELTDVPVLGWIPKLKDESLLPDRHLGLVPPEEHARMNSVVSRLGEVVKTHVDLERLTALARVGQRASVVDASVPDLGPPGVGLVRIGRFCDSAFTFYYPENLEALEAAGAELVQISALEDERLPDVDLLYLGGGFPETHAGLLASNRPLLSAVREAAARGLPIYAECGGLIYLSRSVTYRGDRHELAGVFDIDVEVCPRPQGHGYVSAVVDGPNAFFDEGVSLRGHEFHYSKVVSAELPPTALRVERGKGNAGRRDGLVSQSVLASWIHLHALGAPGWAPALVGAAARWKRRASSVPCAAPAQGHRAPCC